MAADHDVVLTLSDMAQVTTARVAARCGLRGTGVWAARLARDKYRQRALADRAGLPVVQSILVEPGARTAESDLPGPPPWIVKPIDAGGSAAVTLAHTRSELLTACAGAQAQSFAGVCIVEQWIPGSEWSIEIVVVDGAIQSRFFTAKVLAGPDWFVERREVVGQEPDLEDVVAMDDVMRRMVALYEVETAVCHLEVRVDDGTATPIEMAVRAAGGDIPELVLLARGRNLYAELVAALAGRALSTTSAPAATIAGVEYLFGTGTVRRTPTHASVIGGLPGIRYARPLAPVGREIDSVTANWHMAGKVIAVGESVAGVEAALDEAIGRMAAVMGLTRR
jgi:biotin carboxylase